MKNSRGYAELLTEKMEEVARERFAGPNLFGMLLSTFVDKDMRNEAVRRANLEWDDVLGERKPATAD